MKAIIIDDEEKGRKLLRNLLDEYCTDVEILAMADSVAAGIEKIRESNPDVVFLDIVMPNEDGFALLDQLPDPAPELIFATAYDEYAIRAIRACALDYLLKPIDIEELQEAVTRAKERVASKNNNAGTDPRLRTLMENLQNETSKPQKIGFATWKGVTFHQIDDIVVCKAEGNYTTVFLRDRKKLELISKTLKELQELLADYNFLRTHRSYLVNLNHLQEYIRGGSSFGTDGEGGCVVVSGNMKVPVSRDKRKELLERISQPF